MALKSTQYLLLLLVIVNMSTAYAGVLDGSFLTYCKAEACPYGSCDPVSGDCIVDETTQMFFTLIGTIVVIVLTAISGLGLFWPIYAILTQCQTLSALIMLSVPWPSAVTRFAISFSGVNFHMAFPWSVTWSSLTANNRNTLSLEQYSARSGVEPIQLYSATLFWFGIAFMLSLFLYSLTYFFLRMIKRISPLVMRKLFKGKYWQMLVAPVMIGYVGIVMACALRLSYLTLDTIGDSIEYFSAVGILGLMFLIPFYIMFIFRVVRRNREWYRSKLNPWTFLYGEFSFSGRHFFAVHLLKKFFFAGILGGIRNVYGQIFAIIAITFGYCFLVMRVRPYRFSIQIYLDVGSNIFLILALFLCLGLPNLSEGSFLTGLSTLIMIALVTSVGLGLIGSLFGSPYIRHAWDAMKCCGTCWKKQTKPISESNSDEEPKKEVAIVDEKPTIEQQPQFENLEDNKQVDPSKEVEMQENSEKKEEEFDSEKGSSAENSKSEEEELKGVIVEDSTSDSDEEAPLDRSIKKSHFAEEVDPTEEKTQDSTEEIITEEKSQEISEEKSEPKMTEEPMEENSEEISKENSEEIMESSPEKSEEQSIAIPEEDDEDIPIKEEKQEESEDEDEHTDLPPDYYENDEDETVNRGVPPV